MDNLFGQVGSDAIQQQQPQVNVSARFLPQPLIEYEEVSSTTNMAGIPRFGHSNDISHLAYEGNAEYQVEQRNDYIEGLFFVGAFVLAVFGLWWMLLLILKLWSSCCCCCCSSVGFLSGQPFTYIKPEDADMDNKTTTAPTQEEQQHELDKFHKRTSRWRVVFLLSGVVLIVFCILLISQGFQNLEATRHTADHSLDDIRLLIRDASGLAQDLRGVGLDASTLRDQLLVELEKDRLCPNDPNYLIQDEIGRQIQTNAGSAISMLTILGDFTTNEIQQLERGLNDANTAVDDIDVVVEAAADKLWIGIVFAVPLVFLAALMMAATMAAQGMYMTDCLELAMSWFVLPMFALWIVLACALCSGLALAATINADFCAGGTGGPNEAASPDSTILNGILKAGVQETDTEYEVARYFVKQCTLEAQVDPFLFLREHAAEINSAYGTVRKLDDSISGLNVVDLSAQCGRDFEPLRSSLETMMDILTNLEKSANNGLGLLSCERIVPIYADIVYDGTCDTSVTGLAWIFSSLLIISTMGLTMLTLRSSYKNNLVVDASLDHTDDDSELRAMHKLSKQQRQRQKGRARDDNDDIENDDVDLYLQDHQWRDAAVRQRTSSDSDSVYTTPNRSPEDFDDYDHRGNIPLPPPPNPSAPSESQLYY